MLKKPKGNVKKPARPVSVDDMNEAVANRAGWAEAATAILGDIDSDTREWLEMPQVGREFSAPDPAHSPGRLHPKRR